MLEHIPILEMPIAYSSSVAFINQVCVNDLWPQNDIPTWAVNTGGEEWKLGPGRAEVDGWSMMPACGSLGCCWAAWSLVVSSRAYYNTTVHKNNLRSKVYCCKVIQ